MELKINIRIDRYHQEIVNEYFKVNTQSLRFDKNMNLIIVLSHNNLLNLHKKFGDFIKGYKIDGKNTTKSSLNNHNENK